MRPAALLLLTALAAAADPREEAAEAVRAGDRERAAGRPEAALEAYERALRLDPSLPDAWHRRGLLRRAARRLDDALDDLEKAVALAPAHAGFRNDLGLVRADQGDLAGALADYSKAIELDDSVPAFWNNRSFVKRLLGDAGGALEDVTMALQLDPGYARAFLNRGLALYDERQWEDALADLARSVELDPAGQDFTRLRVWILRARLGRREEATRELSDWLAARPDSARDDWVAALAAHLLGKLSEEDLLKRTRLADEKAARLRVSEACFFAGSRSLVEGDAAGAARLLKAALSAGVTNTEVVRSAEAELQGLER